MRSSKVVNLLFWIGVTIYVLSLFLPFSISLVKNTFNLFGSYNPIQNPEPVYGYKSVAMYSLIPILTIYICFSKLTKFTRWLSLIVSILMLFPLFPFYLFTASYCLFCKKEPAVGVYLQIVPILLFLIAAIMYFRIPVLKSKNEIDTNELLDIIE